MLRLSTVKFKQIAYLFLVLFSFVLIFVPKSYGSQANADGLCGNGLGAGLNANTFPVSTSVAAPNVKGRKWTIEELFGGSLKYSVYSGESSSSDSWQWITGTTPANRGKGYPGWGNADVMTKLKQSHGFSHCFFGPVSSGLANGFYDFSNAILSGGMAFIEQLFNPTFICAGGTNTNDCAINLVGIIGGKNDQADNGSLISTLYSGIYAPLIVFAFIFTGCWMMYKGLIKRELRASLSGVLWSILIFMIGVIAMLHPLMLASAPQQINSTVGSCIVGAINGQNCLDGKASAPSSIVGYECQSYGNDTPANELAQLQVGSLGCSMWKSFILNEWTQSQFGRNYSSLYTTSDSAKDNSGTQAIKVSNGSDFCVHLESNDSATDMQNGTVTTGQGKGVCNIALYQLFLNSQLSDPANNSYHNKYSNADIDTRYYNVILAAASDNTTWSAWAPLSWGNEGSRILSAFTVIFIVSIAMVSLVIFTFWGLVYSLAGTLLMAFAPLFLLAGVVPGNGRRMFLGWLESIVSSMLKYAASSLFVLISLTVYAGIISGASNTAMAFIGILVMVGVMFTYRKEIVNLMGQANFGGQRLSNAVGEKIAHKARKVKDISKFAAGSGVGSVLARFNKNRELRKNTPDGQKKPGLFDGALSSFGTGVKEGTERRLQRENNFLGGVVRQKRQTETQLGKETTEEQRDEIMRLNQQLANKGKDGDKPNNDGPDKKPPTNGGSGGAGVNVEDPKACPVCGHVLNKNGVCPSCGWPNSNASQSQSANPNDTPPTSGSGMAPTRKPLVNDSDVITEQTDVSTPTSAGRFKGVLDDVEQVNKDTEDKLNEASDKMLDEAKQANQNAGNLKTQVNGGQSEQPTVQPTSTSHQAPRSKPQSQQPEQAQQQSSSKEVIDKVNKTNDVSQKPTNSLPDLPEKNQNGPENPNE